MAAKCADPGPPVGRPHWGNFWGSLKCGRTRLFVGGVERWNGGMAQNQMKECEERKSAQVSVVKYCLNHSVFNCFFGGWLGAGGRGGVTCINVTVFLCQILMI